LQPPLVFPLSARDNIACGRPAADDAAIENAARLARLDRLFAALPDGYDTGIGEAGVALSEGEKQRVTIARALLRDAPILILDEPTSALDVATEALVMSGIERLMAGRTTFIIAHRLSTVRRRERIAVVLRRLLPHPVRAAGGRRCGGSSRPMRGRAPHSSGSSTSRKNPFSVNSAARTVKTPLRYTSHRASATMLTAPSTIAI
jgi:hypothetical protein